MSVEFRRSQIQENIKKYPALAIDLSAEEIDWYARGGGGDYKSPTDHQKAACRIAAKNLGWHPYYISEVCAAKRPSSMNEFADVIWDKKAARWQQQHDTTIEQLAVEYAEEFDEVGFRLYEPLDWREGVRISAHDMSNPDFPCALADW